MATKEDSDKINRAKGMLVGLAVGDALGAPVEFGYYASMLRADSEKFEHYHKNITHPKGVWTDDTSMALCLGDSLFEKRGYDSYDVMDKYFDWLNFGYNSYFNMGYGVGYQIEERIEEYAKNPVIKKTEPRTWRAGNGAIMRLAPVVIATFDESIEEVMRLARISARETHYSTEAEAGTELFAAMLYLAYHGKKKSEIFDLAQYSTGEAYDEVLKTVMEKPDCLYSELEDLGGYIIDALKIAIWGFYNFDSFKEGMMEVLKLAGDTDTNCAIYGQLAGAFYGFDTFPEDWVNELYSEDGIESLAENLAKMNTCPVLRTRFEEDGPLFAKPPEK